MHQNYTIKQFVIGRYISFAVCLVVVWIALWILIFANLGELSEVLEWIVIGTFVCGFVGLLFLSKRLATLISIYQFDEGGFQQNWKSALLAPASRHVFWKDIASYKIDEDANGVLIKLTLKDKSSIRIANSMSEEDDFLTFKQKLVEGIENYNAHKPEGVSTPILQASSFFEGPAAKVLAVFIGIMLVALTYFQYVSDINWSSLQWWKTIWLYFIGIPFILRVFSANPAKYK